MYLRFGKLCVFSIAGCYLGDLLAELPRNYGQGCQRILSLDMRDTRLSRWDFSPDYRQGCQRILRLDMRDTGTRLSRWNFSPDYGQGCQRILSLDIRDNPLREL